MTPECKEQLRARLKQAENAYHDLMMGGGVRVIKDQNGESVEYTSVSAPRLYAYIIQLRSQLGEDSCGNAVQPTRPISFVF